MVVKRCSHKECASRAIKGGVCIRHGAYKSLTTSIAKAETSSQIIRGGRKITSTSSIDAQVGKIEVRDRQANAAGHPTTACESPSLRPSAVAPSFSDDDEIGAWVYKSRASAQKCAHFCELLFKDCGPS